MTMDFDELRAERQAINNAVLPHSKSVALFRACDRPWFRLTQEEVVDETGGVRHLSTSASCIESLADVPKHQAGGTSAAKILKEVSQEFARGALQRPADEWESEGAAEIYCRVRTLPIILDRADASTVEPFRDQLCEHVVFVWQRLVPDDIELLGISELVKQRSSGDPSTGGSVAPTTSREQHYPPNAFHTRWALRLAGQL
jgi:hypothetical protein